MRTKKVNFNGNTEVFVNFLTQQFPKTYLTAFKVLLDLKYPISDSQVFYDKIEKIKEDEFVKELLFNSFTPGDFSLDSPINALEKFQFNVKRNNIPMTSYGGYDYPFEFNYGRMPASGYSKFTPFKEYQTGTPFQNYGFPMEQFNAFKSPTYFRPQWGMNKEFPQSFKDRDWEFGKDIFGYVAASLFSDLVSKGIKEDFAYNISREKEMACRNFLPTFEVEFNERALFIFANHFILLGKDVKQSYWAAQFFMTDYNTGYKKTATFDRSFDSFSPKMKKGFAEPVM